MTAPWFAALALLCVASPAFAWEGLNGPSGGNHESSFYYEDSDGTVYADDAPEATPPVAAAPSVQVPVQTYQQVPPNGYSYGYGRTPTLAPIGRTN